MLMHADEYWSTRYVDDVFVEPHLQILYLDFIYFTCDFVNILSEHVHIISDFIDLI